ncbi:4-hydroxythreonine-4-phosphate dehydrogenase PdxA [Pseudooceanicola sp. CBS1P-1]|uniref:4-hydroxythreonine-4-phosphate dehydrogenase PdxA n=1 Tax=Pseudooceanicola albus TaxID=2692189 RepID=A0A6L7FXB5_9RHOB|nr:MULTISPECIES: 4-hydroxythreonine-4-phosphate dehydrogenase PdxA [Pseudooceanicola]MBT9383262.1 4-hydroxythreonine-4-phosphate dehydrogenase PdxA [Pseudooceanicola endophyticus]MXN16415.1 4-hydroxythreonine-4-phosphate dehydrogenase PdxA [Pseudooceanicola albus]
MAGDQLEDLAGAPSPAGGSAGGLVPLGVTLGDPSGIGPEIALRAVIAEGAPQSILLGQRAVAERARALVAPEWTIQVVSGPEEAALSPRHLRLIETGVPLAQAPDYGQVSAASGAAAFAAIRAGIALAMAGRTSGIVTAPIHKEALSAAGVPFPGHTEMLAHYAGDVPVAMMLANDVIRTVLVTIHVSLRDAIGLADFDAQMRAIRLAHEGCRAFGIAAPRVAVAGLNPHAGEGGLFGREEIEIIAPAIAAARAEGIDASGPWPGDTVFMQARKGAFDVVVAQYHDQGLIPVKYLGLEEGVNITLGLPFVRTSPDHGTAFDIAGQGIADPRSMSLALSQARAMVLARGA